MKGKKAIQSKVGRLHHIALLSQSPMIELRERRSRSNLFFPLPLTVPYSPDKEDHAGR